MAPASAADSILKSGEVSAMIKQGFFLPSSSPSISPLSSPPPSSSSASSPPPQPPPRPRPATLFEMIAQENFHQYQQLNNKAAVSPTHQKRLRLRARLSKVLAEESHRSDWGPADVDLTVSSAEGFRVSMAVHRSVLAARSRFFAEKFGGGRGGGRVAVEICDCDEVEVYVEVVALMYCKELKQQLIGEDVQRILGLLKISAAMMFDAGVASCLEVLEAAPWSDDEEEKVISTISHLQLHEPVTNVLQRVSVELSASSRIDSILSRLLDAVIQAKDEKARREIKTLIAGLLRNDTEKDSYTNNGLDVTVETIYHHCHECLNHLLYCLAEATSMVESHSERVISMSEIAREADNLQWLVEILIGKKIAEQFVALWADQKQLVLLHSKIPRMYRFEISRITAQLCIGIGKGHILVPRDARFALLETWLEALYDDFHWMKRACKMFDKRTLEDGLSHTILTLSMSQQQEILLRWFEQFLDKGDDCPNIHKAFQVWWRRAFVRKYVGNNYPSQLQVTTCNFSS